MYSFRQLLQESKRVGLKAELSDDYCILDARNEPAIPAPEQWVEDIFSPKCLL
jgi:hypothetical protein